MRLVLDGRLSNVWTAIPGIVKSVDLATLTCEVQPAIQGTVQKPDGSFESVNYPLLVDVPIVFPSVAGFLVTLPLAAGDEVLVVMAARCIDAWWKLGDVQRPQEARMHDLSDGFAIPGPRSQPKVTGMGAVSSTGAQVRNFAGTTYVEIAADGKIKLVSASEIDFTVPVVKMSGSLEVTGQVTGNGVALSTHVHSGVTPGIGTSGPPV